MAVAIGKRKREVVRTKPSKTTHVEELDTSASESEERLKAIFQRHFETQFKPLPEPRSRKEEIQVKEAVEDDVEDDSWGGFSSAEDDAPVQVVEYSEARFESEPDAVMSKRESKAFLSGKVPSSALASRNMTKSATTMDEEDKEDDKINLKNDLALQRLLSESHLLDSAQSNDSLEATGKNRLRALDIRMQSLGAKSSVFDGGKMPMNMRKGVLSHREEAEHKRRKEARENGIILEKEKRQKKFMGRRERGVGGPSVGKYKGGILTLSKRDVRNIEGPKEVKKSGKRGGRR